MFLLWICLRNVLLLLSSSGDVGDKRNAESIGLPPSRKSMPIVPGIKRTHTHTGRSIVLYLVPSRFAGFVCILCAGPWKVETPLCRSIGCFAPVDLVHTLLNQHGALHNVVLGQTLWHIFGNVLKKISDSGFVDIAALSACVYFCSSTLHICTRKLLKLKRVSP